MAANFQVHFTATAEKDYQTLYEEAKIDGENGEPNSYRSALLDSIDKAIDEQLAYSPIKPEIALAGGLSFIYMLNLGLVCIYYMAYAEDGRTYILHIGPSQKGNDLSEIREAVRKGEIDDWLEQLGIEKSHILGDTPRVWIN